MILILIAIVVAAVIAAALLWYGENGYSGAHTAAMMFGMCLILATGVAAVCYVFAGFSWLAADSKAQIINREYGTQYTQAEVFWASDVIDTIREIDRRRIEVNGDLMRDEQDK